MLGLPPVVIAVSSGAFLPKADSENRRKERTDSITQEKEVGLGCEGPAASLYRHLLATCLIT